MVSKYAALITLALWWAPPLLWGQTRGTSVQENVLATDDRRTEALRRGDVAVVLSRDKSVILLGGQQVGGDVRLTRVYKMFGADWRLIATHGSLVAQ